MADKPVSTPKFGEAVQKFVKAGIHPRYLIPVAPPGAKIGPNASLSEKVLGKAPGRYNAKRDEWGGLRGAVVVEGMTRADFEDAADWPTGNVGLLGKAFPAIDSDAMSPAARRLVDRVLDDVFGGLVFAERFRGNNDRRLYAFKAYNVDRPVNTRHVVYTLDGVEHKLDVIGNGGQYLIAGTHPSGDAYEWDSEFGLHNPGMIAELEKLDNTDIDNFIEALTAAVEKAGGEMGKIRGGGGNFDERAVKDLDAVLPNDTILEALERLPNSPDNFLHRDDFVGALSAIRAAAGRNGSDPQFVQGVREWATASGDDWCDDAYFDKIWKSLDRVRTPQDALDRLFRRNKIYAGAQHEFAGSPASAVSANIEKGKAAIADDRRDFCKRVSAKYIFSDIDTLNGKSVVPMRDKWSPATEWPAQSWFMSETTFDCNLAHEARHLYGDKTNGFFRFIQDMRNNFHDISFFDGDTLNPYEDFGEIIVDSNADRNRTLRLLNRWHLPAAIRHGRRADKNPARSAEDVRHVLEYIETLFGKEMAQYELDTLAYMVQAKQRPGSMLFLVGEPGVGKSLYTRMCTLLFNGGMPEQAGVINGTKLINDASRRFALASVEGCRIISIREMPKGQNNSKALKEITAELKMLVDPGGDGDYFQIEKKGQDLRMVQNFARIMLTSNHGDAIEIEAHDRRIFMVEVKIIQGEKPPEKWYSRFVDVYSDPERLAAFYRYLETRDIGDYSRNKPPPVSTAKSRSIVARINNPAERHARAAIEMLRSNGRLFTDSQEIGELMTEMSKAEAEFRGDGELLVDYDRLRRGTKDEAIRFMNAIKTARNLLISLKPRRDGKSRDARVYVIGTHGRAVELAEDLEGMSRYALQDTVREEIARGTPKAHPWEEYRA